MLTKRDTGEVSLNEVVLPALLAGAHPLGELALSDIETDGTVGGIMGATKLVLLYMMLMVLSKRIKG